MSREEIMDRVTFMMSEMFELERDTLKPEAHLVDDLGLDSIDAIDMAVELQEITGRRVEEIALRKVRTVADVVNLVETQLTSAQG